MEPSIRPAVPSDADAIGVFTTDTFDWGDYVADQFPEWLADPTGRVLVATDDEDRAVAVGRGQMLSATELWLQGARVNDEWRRRGLATTIGHALIDWAKLAGAQVARLAIEEWNTPARRQVEKAGFRPVGAWVVGSRSVDTGEPATSTNGGKRARARRRLERAHSSEAVPAWVSWRSGPLLQPARGLHTRDWRWSRLHLEDLAEAAKRGRLWTSQAGWAWAERTGDRIAVGWLECGADDSGDMVRSLVDLAVSIGAERLRVTVPAVEWLLEALRASNCELHAVVIYELAL